MIVTNHRPLVQSYFTCGSDVPDRPSTGLKKLSVEAFNAPRLPFLSKSLIRPLPQARTCVGPMAPHESGGTKPDSLSRGPLNAMPTVCGFERTPPEPETL